MPVELSLLQARIRKLIDEPGNRPPGLLVAEMEHTLTDGYASALEIERERWRLAKEIGERAMKLDDEVELRELRTLGERLATVEEELTRLRSLLELLRRRAESVRSSLPAAVS